MPNRGITALTEILRPEIDLSKSRLETLCPLVLGMVSARSMNLSHIASQRSGTVQTASSYRRLQRFFQHVRLDEDWALPLLIRLPGPHGSWLLALGRMNWQIGKTEFSRACARHPSFPGAPHLDRDQGARLLDTAMRIALMKRYLADFPAKTVRLLLADREFAGAGWKRVLCENNILVASRIGDNLRITTGEGHDRTLQVRLHQVRRSRIIRARPGSREDTETDNAPLLTIAAKPLKDGWLIVVTNVEAQPHFAPTANAGRSNACSAMPGPGASIQRARVLLIRASSACSCRLRLWPSPRPVEPLLTSLGKTHRHENATAITPNPSSGPASTTSETGSERTPLEAIEPWRWLTQKQKITAAAV